MKKVAIALVILVAAFVGYAAGVVRATRKAMREDRLAPALFAIAVEKAKEAQNLPKAQEVDQLRLKRAIEEVAALSEIRWSRVILESTRDAEGYPEFMAVVANYVSKHPEIELSPAARTYLSRFQKNEPNQAAEPTRTTVTPPAGAGDRASGARGSP